MSGSKSRAPIRPFAAVAHVGATQRAGVDSAVDELQPLSKRRTGTTDDLASAMQSVTAERTVARLEEGIATTGTMRNVDTVQQLMSIAVGETVNVATQLFGDNSSNAREFYIPSEVDETAQSFQLNGQDVAVGAWVEGGKALPMDGGKRVRAARIGAVLYLRTTIVEKPAGKLVAWLTSRRMNSERSPHTIYDDAVRFRQFLDDKTEVSSQEALAAALSEPGKPPISQGYVSQIVSIGAIPRRLMQRLVEVKSLTSKNAAYVISRLFTPDGLGKLALSEDDPTLEGAGLVAAERVAETIILTAIEHPEMTSSEVRAMVDKALGVATRAPRAKSQTEPASLGKWRAKLTTIPEHKLLQLEFRDVEESDMEVLKAMLQNLLQAGAKDGKRT